MVTDLKAMEPVIKQLQAEVPQIIERLETMRPTIDNTAAAWENGFAERIEGHYRNWLGAPAGIA